jgi:hypothetical protein
MKRSNRAFEGVGGLIGLAKRHSWREGVGTIFLHRPHWCCISLMRSFKNSPVYSPMSTALPGSRWA